MTKVAILGGSGYTGLELLRLLALHRSVKVEAVTSRQYAGRAVAACFPFLGGYYDDLKFSPPSIYDKVDAGVVFSALPHGASQEVVPELVRSGRKVVDLSADFRLSDPAVYEKWYGEHRAKDLLEEAVYGLTEVYRENIEKAQLVANPGCYPTGAVLALLPLLKAGLITGTVIIDSKSGVSGAGRHPSHGTLFTEVSGGFKAYKVGCHRHTPEMEQALVNLAGAPVEMVFTPHLLPVSRGILTTAYAGLKEGFSTEELHVLYDEAYRDERFVRLMPTGNFPNINQVRLSNFCDIGVWGDKKTKRVVIVSAIDNLVKGASGQALQNMNLMEGFDEAEALTGPPAFV